MWSHHRVYKARKDSKRCILEDLNRLPFFSWTSPRVSRWSKQDWSCPRSPWRLRKSFRSGHAWGSSNESPQPSAQVCTPTSSMFLFFWKLFHSLSMTQTYSVQFWSRILNSPQRNKFAKAGKLFWRPRCSSGEEISSALQDSCGRYGRQPGSMFQCSCLLGTLYCDPKGMLHNSDSQFSKWRC